MRPRHPRCHRSHRESSLSRHDYSEGGEGGPEPADGPAEAADAGTDVAPAIELDARAGAGERLDRFLASALAGRVDGASRSRIQHWIALGAVWCDERPLTRSTRLSGVERIHVQPLPRDADRAFEPDDVPLAIVDEDADLVVIDKPAGLVMHPGAGNWRGTLLNGLLHHRPALAALPRAGIVHRLDKDTSGLVVVACNEASLASLVDQLSRRTVSRRYLALVHGRVPDAGCVDAPIGRDSQQRTRMAVVGAEAGRFARTHFTRLAVADSADGEVCLVECRLETGRTHQIRVHMRHLGHPLLGDSLYGGRTALIGRQALHAWRLALAHPADGGARHWVSVPPADLRALAQSLGLDLQRVCDDLDARIRT